MSTTARLLLIGTGGQPYREYLLRSIGAAYRVHLLLGAPATWEPAHVAGHTVLDLTDTVGADDLIATARRLAGAEPFAGVLAWDEARVLQAAKVAAALGLPGGDVDAVMRCRDKHLTRSALAAAAVAQPRSVAAGTVAAALAVAEEIGYPVVLKPRAMAASLGVVRVDTPTELADRFAFAHDTTLPGAWRYDEVLVEEFVAGQEISLDCAVHRGVVHPMFLAHKETGYPPYFEEVGHVVDGADPLLTDPAVGAVLRDAHAALGVTDGMTHTELKLTPDGPKVIEVNARLGGDLIPYLGSLATGVDPGVVAADVACGRTPVIAPDRALVAAVRFGYVTEPDTTIGSVAIDRSALPGAVTDAVALLGPGDLASPPPAGTLVGRVSYTVAVAETAARCRAALDTAREAVTVVPADLAALR